MILFLSDSMGHESLDESTEWIKAVHRGGLQHVSDDLCAIFYHMEDECRMHFTSSQTKTKQLNNTMKQRVKDALMNNEDICVDGKNYQVALM
jgi:hypothetical protein